MVKTMPYSEHEVQPAVHTKNGTIACPICSALYAPVAAHAYLLQSPPLALESAFMSMCHFCFRCRRPACPRCWDDVHGLCGSCVENVHLPFRQKGEPLPLNSILLIPSSPSPQQRHATTFPLVCVQPGRFQADSTQAEPEPMPEPINDIAPTPDVQQQSVVHETPVQDVVVPPVAQERKNIAALGWRVERVMTLVLGLILFVIAVLIVVASFSEQANTAIASVLHVDIRMEIEYLLQLIQQFH